jgi:hypothetical protein
MKRRKRKTENPWSVRNSEDFFVEEDGRKMDDGGVKLLMFDDGEVKRS